MFKLHLIWNDLLVKVRNCNRPFELPLKVLISIQQRSKPVVNKSRPTSYRRNESDNTAGERFSPRKCYRCGSGTHLANSPDCKARNSSCNSCQRPGHFSKVCRQRVS